MANPLAKAMPPAIDKTAFSCPHCGTKTTQYWYDVRLSAVEGTPLVKKTRISDGKRMGFPVEVDMPTRVFPQIVDLKASRLLENSFVSVCMECGNFALWFGSQMRFPTATSAPPPSIDMPDEAKVDYLEAARILSQSPRGAAALLRLAVERVCIHLGYKTGTINAKIEQMVEDGLPLAVERALDVVRVVGNEAVHPGQLNLKDDLDTATKLFDIVNYIVLDRITRPKELEQLFNEKVSDGAKANIAKRRPNPEDSEA